MKTRMTGRFIVIIIVLFFLGCKNPFGGDDSSKISLFFQPNQNKAPIAKDDTLSTNKNIAVSNQLQATDANGDALTFSIVTQPTLGSIQLSATGSYTYTPTTNAIGSDSITFEAYDGNLKSNLATVAITINNTAATPVANNITPADIAEDVQSGTITLSYSDVDGDLATSCSITTLTNITETQACACTSGVCTVKVTGTANYNGAASFSYTVTTLAEVSNVATATLNITAVNDAPTISAISDISTSFTTAKQVSFTISDDSALSCSTSLAFISNNTTLLSHSNIAWSGTAPNCTATLTPNPHREGTSSLTIRATDSSGASTDRSFTLTVTPPHPNALKLWLSADKGITKDVSSFVSQWADQSGNGNHATATGAEKPLFVATGLNGYSAVRGNGVDQFMTVSGLGSSWGSSVGTMYIVFSPNDTQFGLVHFATTNDGYYRFSAGDGYFATFRSARKGNRPKTRPTSGNYILTLASGASQYEVFENGVQIDSFESSFGVSANLQLFKEPAAGFLNGDISEILVFNNSHSTQERRSIECYLAMKYGFTISSYECTPLAPTQKVVNVATSASVTIGAQNGVPPYAYTLSSGNGSVNSSTGVFSAPAVAGDSVVTITDLVGSTSTVTIHTYTTLPTSYPGLKGWWDAASLSGYKTLGAIGKWEDLSGNLFHAYALNLATAKYVENSLNGFPTVRSLSSHFVVSGLGTSWGTTNGSMFIVVNLTGDTNYGMLDFSSSADYWRLSATGKAYQGTFRSARIDNTGVMPTAGAYVMSIVSGPTAYQKYLNGTNLINTTSSFGVQADLILFNQPGGGAFYDGDTAEVIFYNTQMNSVDRAAVECYLGRKYNITSAITASCPP